MKWTRIWGGGYKSGEFIITPEKASGWDLYRKRKRIGSYLTLREAKIKAESMPKPKRITEKKALADLQKILDKIDALPIDFSENLELINESLTKKNYPQLIQDLQELSDNMRAEEDGDDWEEETIAELSELGDDLEDLIESFNKLNEATENKVALEINNKTIPYKEEIKLWEEKTGHKGAQGKLAFYRALKRLGLKAKKPQYNLES